jgi:hypothetical protein
VTTAGGLQLGLGSLYAYGRVSAEFTNLMVLDLTGVQ